jgi:hypothetical protein
VEPFADGPGMLANCAECDCFRRHTYFLVVIAGS